MKAPMSLLAKKLLSRPDLAGKLSLAIRRAMRNGSQKVEIFLDTEEMNWLKKEGA